MKKETQWGKYFENVFKKSRKMQGQEENLERGKDSKIELKGKVNSEGR